MAKNEKKWPGEPEGLWDNKRLVIARRDTRSAPERLFALMDEGSFVFPYPRATHIKQEVHKIMRGGRREPFAGAMIAGPRANGRSSLARQLVDANDYRPDVWFLTMPTRAAYDDLWLALLATARHRPTGYDLPSAARQIQAHEALREAARQGLKLIVVDGSENLLDVSASRRRLMLHCIERMWDVGGIPVLLIGTPTLASRILSDKDRVGLYEIFLLPQWRLDTHFLDLLQAWDNALPLQHRSGLAERELAMHLYALSDGILGALAGLLKKAAAAAILNRQEKIDIALLDALGYEVPQSFSGFMF